MATEPETREHEAWEARYKHAKAARTWDAVAQEKPDRRAVSEILARWMYAYEAADAEAEAAFRALAATERELGDREIDTPLPLAPNVIEARRKP